MQQLLDFGWNHFELVISLILILFLIGLFELFMKLTGTTPLSPQQAVFLINQEKAVILDMREANYFSKSHILNAVSISLTSLHYEQLYPYKKKPIIISFMSGQNHYKLGRLLKKHGFTQLYHLKGGITAWESAGFPLTKN